jgi:hypothetical protein
MGNFSMTFRKGNDFRFVALLAASRFSCFAGIDRLFQSKAFDPVTTDKNIDSKHSSGRLKTVNECGARKWNFAHKWAATGSRQAKFTAKATAMNSALQQVSGFDLCGFMCS